MGERARRRVGMNTEKAEERERAQQQPQKPQKSREKSEKRAAVERAQKARC